MTREEIISNLLYMKHSVKEDTIEDITIDEAIKVLQQEPCTDAISRQAAIDAFERFIHELGIKDEPYNYGEMALSPQNVPSVTPAEKVGQWIYDRTKDWDGECKYECSECGMGSDVDYAYCMRCGAKMQEVENG